MWATVSGVSVQIATLQPSRAAAYAASHPACPAPITITSKLSAINSHQPLPQRTQRKNRGQNEFFFLSKKFSGPLHFLCALCGEGNIAQSLTDTETREDVAQQVFRRA